MIVLDASFVVEVLLAKPERADLARRLAAAGPGTAVPHLVDAEVTSALRALVRRGVLDERRAELALEDFVDLPLARHTHVGILSRTFAISAGISAYGAVYVALAEALGATLWTCDGRLASRAGSFVEVESF